MSRTPGILAALSLALGLGACVAADDTSSTQQLASCYDVDGALGCVPTPDGLALNPRDVDGDGIANQFVCGDVDSGSDSDGDSDSDSTSDSISDDGDGDSDSAEESSESGDELDSDSDSDSESDEQCGDGSGDGDGDGVPDADDCDCGGEDPGDPPPDDVPQAA